MPCYTTRTVKTDLNKSNFERLAATFQNKGWKTALLQDSNGNKDQVFSATLGMKSLVFRKGSDSVQIVGMEQAESDKLLADIKRLYAEMTVTEAAKKFGFRVQQRQVKNETVTIKMGK